MKSILKPIQFDFCIFLLGICFPFLAHSAGPPLTRAEEKLIAQLKSQRTENMQFLEKIVNIPTGTLHHADGILSLSQLFETRLKEIGFRTWNQSLTPLSRGVHLFAENGGEGPRILLVGHLDTVFENENKFRWKKLSNGDIQGPGVGDMKAGDVIIVSILEAFHKLGELKKMNIAVALMGDEEAIGLDSTESTQTSRAELLKLGKTCDYVLGFEPAHRKMGTVKLFRRGAMRFQLKVQAPAGHSTEIFNTDKGEGAIFPLIKVLQALQEEVVLIKEASFNVGQIVAGEIQKKNNKNQYLVSGKENVIPGEAEVIGDIRFSSNTQAESIKKVFQKKIKDVIQKINKKYTAQFQTTVQITFSDIFPVMNKNAESSKALSALSQASLDLGYGKVSEASRFTGAGDAAFLADGQRIVIDGLGPAVSDIHSEKEVLYEKSLWEAMEKVALFVYRIKNEPANPTATPSIE